MQLYCAACSGAWHVERVWVACAKYRCIQHSTATWGAWGAILPLRTADPHQQNIDMPISRLQTKVTKLRAVLCRMQRHLACVMRVGSMRKVPLHATHCNYMGHKTIAPEDRRAALIQLQL
jgi:hypothetical protein